MNAIFVNYRTSDGDDAATLIERELSRAFGDEQVFRASKSIQAGSRFPREILSAVRRCSVLLAVIGPRWLEARSSGGGRALEDPDDWTRREILEAFEAGAVVVPVLLGQTGRLKAQDLPEALAELADCQYRRLNNRNADGDLGRLVADLSRLVPELAKGPDGQGDERPGDDSAAGQDAAPPARVRAKVIKHRHRGGIGNVNGDFSGTFVSEPSGPVHTGSGNVYQERRRRGVIPPLDGEE
ncbi:toll/interleukin-1 receptor domain-containing protein [Streptomyces sp. NRRL F-2799]|uniref:toll/interleukin-1 receptor domain-containing protein n=1 Tax=Streptomyces sp. NRRL F-2799 TaxID=1463844 RepID=UPI000689549E|nr:toll/interleukin-1 receptor domain-containing protein [Streptomyces sp. NRRL F-2799]